MLTPRDVLEAPVTYDLIVSDFGRDAAIEYLKLVAARERRLIEPILRGAGCEFFDEYRRIMFTVIADVAFFKRSAIANSTKNCGYLTEDILVGVGATPISRDFVDRVAISVVQEILAALGRGHELLRVAIPCNGLSVLAQEVARIISSEMELSRIVGVYAPGMLDFSRIATARIRVRTVPEAVVQHLAAGQEPGRHAHLLVLGTRGTNAQYELLTNSSALIALPIEDAEYELIERSIVASIGGDLKEIAKCRERLGEELITPRRRLFEDLIVLEACTDFRLGLGVSSLELFADAMVADCYNLSHDATSGNESAA